MKKALAILITVCLLASLFVSCDNNAKIDELVSVSFDALDTRALEVNNEAFIDIQAPSLVWEYMATKVSDVKYNVGAASTWTPIPGITPGKITNVVEFSQGKWNFELRAVTKDEAGNVTCVIYYGKTDIATPVLLTKQSGGAKYYIPINLTAQLSGQKGYIVLSNISVKHLSSGTEILDAPSKVFIDGKELASGNYTSTGTSISTASKGLEYTVGTHRVKVQKIGANGEVLAEEEKTIEVYAGLKTTVSNWIVEITQGGQFAPVAPTGTTTESIPASEEYVTLTVANVSPSMTSGNGTSVTVPTSIFNDKTKPVTVKVSVKEATEASNSFTASSTSNAVAAVIDLTLLEGDTQKTDFGDSTVLVETYVAKNLSGFQFRYPGEEVEWSPKNSLEDVTAAKDYYYDGDTGKLTFLTDHFSSFVVETSSVAVIGDTAYSTFSDALSHASEGDTIVLINDIKIDYESGNCCISIEDKIITIDGSGKTISLGAESPENDQYGILVKGNDSSKIVTIKNATINTNNLERAIRTEGSIGVVIEDCTITTNGVGIHVKGANEVVINNTQITVNVIDNTTYLAHLRTAVMVGGAEADVTVNECTINAVNENKTDDKNTMCKGLYVGAFSTNAKLTAKDTSVSADYSIAIDGAQNDHTSFEGKPTQIVIESGTYTGTIGTPGGYSYKSLTINGGTFSGLTSFDGFNSKTDDVAKLVISGGIFDVEPASKYIDDRYYAELNEDGKYEVKRATDWIQVADTSWYNETELVFTISNARELSGLALLVNEGNNFSGKTINLVSNIDLSGKTWTPIGAYSGKSFCGIFDGNSNTISNLKIDCTETPYDANGLFGFISKQDSVNSSVKNIIISNANINTVSNGKGGIGVAIGNVFPGCTIDNIKVSESTVVGNRWIGGIVGKGYCTISNCSVENISLTANQDRLTGKWDNGDKVGGIIGYLCEMSGDPKLTRCKAKGVTIVGYRDLGGIAGLTQSNLASNEVEGSLSINIQFNDNYENYNSESITAGVIFGRSGAHYNSDNSKENTSTANCSIDKTALDN